MYPLRTLISLLALALAVVLVGCGGGGEGSTSTLTKAELIKQADAACRKADEVQGTSLSRYAKEHPKGPESKSSEDKILLTIGLPPIEEELESLKELGAPESGAEQVEAVVDALETAIAKIEANPSSIAKGTGTPLEKANQLAAKYGFKVCSDFL